MSTTYRVTFHTQGTVTAFVEVPDEVEEPDRDDIASEMAHELASEHIDTWGTHQPVLLDMSIDGIGADKVEEVEE